MCGPPPSFPRLCPPPSLRGSKAHGEAPRDNARPQRDTGETQSRLSEPPRGLSEDSAASAKMDTGQQAPGRSLTVTNHHLTFVTMTTAKAHQALGEALYTHGLAPTLRGQD